MVLMAKSFAVINYHSYGFDEELLINGDFVKKIKYS